MAIPDKHLADIKKYDKTVNMKLANALYKRLAGSMARSDARYIAFKDAREVGRVRNGFIKKTLGVTKRSACDEACAAVEKKMSKDRTKSRLTAYYLLAQELKKASRVKSKYSPSACCGVSVRISTCLQNTYTKNTMYHY